MNKSKKNAKKKTKKTDGAVYYTGRVPHRFQNRIPPNNIWNDATFQVMAHELLHVKAPIQNLGYYIHQTGARYLVPKRSPIKRSYYTVPAQRSPVRVPVRSPVQRRRYHPSVQHQTPAFKRAIDDFLRYKQKLNK